MISSKALILSGGLSSGKGRPLLIQVNQNASISLRPLLALMRSADRIEQCLSSAAKRKTSARTEFCSL
jgi:hypothetical protein